MPLPDNEWRGVPGVDVSHNSGSRIKGGVEQRGIQMFKGRAMKQSIYSCYQAGQVSGNMPDFRTQSSLQIRHQSSRSKTFTANVSDRNVEFAIRSDHKIVEVPSHSLGLTTHCVIFDALERRRVVRKEPLLDRGRLL